MKKIILILLTLVISGCGYTTGSLLPAHLKTIYVEPFRNKIELTDEISVDRYRFRSYSPHMEIDITKEVIDRFVNDGNLKVTEERNADIVLSGELIDYLRQPLRYGNDNETVIEYRVSIVCSVRARDIDKDLFLWQDGRVIGDSTYNVSGNLASSESSAIASAVSDLARRILNRTIEGW
jgi:hypothetical protein